MLLKNFASMLNTAFISAETLSYFPVKLTNGKSPLDSFYLGMPTAPNSTTTGKLTFANAYNSSTASFPNASITWAWALGDGDTPPTVDDYKLSGNLLTSKLEILETTRSRGNNGIIYTHIITNISEEVVTIKEVGLCFGYNVNSSSSGWICMVTRDVLSEPLVLQVGEQKVLEYNINTFSFVEAQV